MSGHATANVCISVTHPSFINAGRDPIKRSRLGKGVTCPPAYLPKRADHESMMKWCNGVMERRYSYEENLECIGGCDVVCLYDT